MPAPSASKRSTGMVEKANDLLERILKKVPHREEWPLRVQRSAYELNRREIRSLGFSPYEIMFRYQSPSSLELKIPILRRSQLHFLLYNTDLNSLDEDEHASSVLNYMTNLDI